MRTKAKNGLAGLTFGLMTIALVFAVMYYAGLTSPAKAVDGPYTVNATATATELKDTPGVYKATARIGDSMKGDNPCTLGIPSVAKQTLDTAPTTESPAIIMGAAVNYEKKVPGQVAYDPIPGGKVTAPYSYFRYQIMEEKGQDGTVHKKLSGFDGSYYIVRVDVSNIVNNITNPEKKYLHVKQENNKALMVAVGMGGDKQSTWTYCNGMNKTGSYSLANGAAALKDSGPDDTDKDKPYLDVILYSSGKLADGADAGTSQATGADVKLSFYVDKCKEYNDLEELDPNNMPTFPLKKTVKYTKADGETTFEKEVTFNDELKYKEALLEKFYVTEYPKENESDPAVSTETNDNRYTSYIVKGSDLEIDCTVDETENGEGTPPEFWSLTKAIYHHEYDSHTIKLICEVPVLEALEIKGSPTNYRSVILDVNSFDIQIANHKDKNTAGLTVGDCASLEIDDNTMTYGAELAVGNNANMEVQDGGTLIVGESCALEVEYDAASVMPGEQAPDLTNGEIIVQSGGTLINDGVVNIEGMEAKPIEPGQGGQQPAQRDVRGATMIVKYGGTFENNGCLGIKGSLKMRGTLNNYGRYNDVITAGDPDKGTIDHHRGIQVTWKDVVTTPGVNPGDMDIGPDELGTDVSVGSKAVLNNYGDIVLVPGTFNLYGTFNNVKAPYSTDEYAGHLYLCTVDEAVIPIPPDPNDPTKVEERVKVDPPRESIFVQKDGSKTNNKGFIGKAKVEIVHNGVLGKLTPIYTVVFVPNDGSAVKPQVVLAGEKITKPEDPTKEWSVFGGWFKDSTLEKEWNFDKDVAIPDDVNESEIKLYAKWTLDVEKLNAVQNELDAVKKELEAEKKDSAKAADLKKESDKVTALQKEIKEVKKNGATKKQIKTLKNRIARIIAANKKLKIKGKALKGKKVRLTWKKVKGVSGFVVYQAKSKKGKYKKVATVKKPKARKWKSKKLRKIKKGKKVFYKMRTYTKVNGKKVFGKWSNKVKVKIK